MKSREEFEALVKKKIESKKGIALQNRRAWESVAATAVACFLIFWISYLAVPHLMGLLPGSGGDDTTDIGETTCDTETEPLEPDESLQGASSNLAEIINASDSYKDIPIYGAYLEQTSSIVRQYFKNGALYATVALSDGKMTQDFDIYNPLGNTNCLDITKRCQSDYPNDPIIGYVYVTDGYSIIYPVVMNTKDNKIQYYLNKLVDFGMVDSFRTIEEGRQSFVDYFAELERIRSEIPVYLWKKADSNYNYSYIDKFLLDDMWNDIALMKELPNTDFIFEYDHKIAIPLLDENGNEGIYVGYLLYHKNKLIAEFVIKVDQKIYVAEYIKVADYDAKMQTFDPLKTSNYETAIKAASNKADPLTFNGIQWKADAYYVVYPD